MTPEEAEKLKNYRAQLFRDANNFIKPERTPHLGAFISWKILDAGYKYSEAFTDYDIFEKSQRYFLDRYQIDTLMGNGYCIPFRVMQAMGHGYFYYDDEYETVGVEQYAMSNFEDYMAFADDWNKNIWEKACPNKFENWGNRDLSYFQNSVNEYIENNKYHARIFKIINDEYALADMVSFKYGGGEMGAEKLFKHLLGIKNFSIEMRRNFAKVKEFCDRIDDGLIGDMVNKIYSNPDGPEIGACYDVPLLLLAHTVMNHKQFEQLYWPGIKRVLDASQEKKKHVRVTIEGSGMHFFDLFSDYPKGVYALNLEQDDIFEARKMLPNACLIGGMPVTTLGKGTKQQCLDKAKQLIDELGANGGYVFSEDKFVSYRNDANSENLKAVCDFVVDYRP